MVETMVDTDKKRSIEESQKTDDIKDKQGTEDSVSTTIQNDHQQNADQDKIGKDKDLPSSTTKQTDDAIATNDEEDTADKNKDNDMNVNDNKGVSVAASSVKMTTESGNKTEDVSSPSKSVPVNDNVVMKTSDSSESSSSKTVTENNTNASNDEEKSTQELVATASSETATDNTVPDNVHNKSPSSVVDHSDTHDPPGKNATAASAYPAKPIKRARTAYLIFSEDRRAKVQAEHPGESMPTIAKILGQLWGNLKPEEKEVYTTKAAEEREQVAKQIELYKNVALPQDQQNNMNCQLHDPTSLIFPLTKIRKICKLDPEIHNVAKEGTVLITKCAELFAEKLGKETVRFAQIQNRRKLLPDDVAQVCSTREQFLFLREDIKDIVKQQIQSKQLEKEEHHNNNNAETKTTNSKPLTAYFGLKE